MLYIVVQVCCQSTPDDRALRRTYGAKAQGNYIACKGDENKEYWLSMGRGDRPDHTRPTKADEAVLSGLHGAIEKRYLGGHMHAGRRFKSFLLRTRMS